MNFEDFEESENQDLFEGDFEFEDEIDFEEEF